MSKAKKSFPLIIAHRGFSAKYPENTLVAFENAVAAGADMIEFDVNLTLDNEIVVLHDETVDRTTNGSGLISTLRWQDVQALDAGVWFHGQFQGEQIPGLGPVLERLQPYDIQLNIEIKPEAWRTDARMELSLLEKLDTFSMMERCIISSFHPDILRRIRLASAVRLAFLYEEAVPGIGNLEEAIAFSRGITCISLNLNKTLVDAETLDRIHAAHLECFVYTVNELSEMKQSISIGVDGIFTNHPDRLLALKSQSQTAM